MAERSPCMHRKSHPELPNVEPYEYKSLEDPSIDIRLVTIHPGGHEADIRISIDATALQDVGPKARPDHLLSQAELRQGLPDGYKAFTTLEDTYLFLNTRTGTTSWTHPDPCVDDKSYRLPPHYPNPHFTPKYEALSYVWGSKEETDSVFVEMGHTSRLLMVNKNLYEALGALRLRHESRTIWIDALSINQKDVVERSAQVARMALIYSRAYRVVVWLGQASSDSELLLEMLDIVASNVEISDDFRYYLPSPNCTDRTAFRQRQPVKFSSQQWRALECLLDRPWFSRLWVWQEIFLSNRRAVVRCGNTEFNWSDFRRTLLTLRRKRDEGIPAGLYAKVGHLKHLLGSFQPNNFERLIEHSARKTCADPRDHIYGLLGLVIPRFSCLIKPDYSLSVSEVFIQAHLAHLETYGTLDLLARCGVQVWQADLPTWTPQWSRPTQHVSSNRHFWASGRSAAYARPISSQVLEVTGLLVTEVSRMLPHKQSTFEAMMARSSFHGTEQGTDDKSFSGSSRGSAMIECLVMGKTIERFPQKRTYPSMEMLGMKLSNDTKSCVPLDRKWHKKMTDLLSTRVLADTNHGHIGLFQNGTQPGDILVILLGFWLPIVLRPTLSGQFEVVGDAYVHGLCNGEAILGPFSPKWIFQVLETHQWSYWETFLNEETGKRTGLDPRLGPLPEGWEGIQLLEDDIPNPNLFRDNDTGRVIPLFTSFRNTATGEVTKFDPRLSKEVLEARGVPLRTFELI